MLPNINPTTTNAWQLLKQHYQEIKSIHIKELFQDDSARFNKYSFAVPDIIWDYSKNIITDKTLELLLQLAEECELKAAMEAMFGGEKINETENRAVLHTALRNFSGKPVFVDGNDIMPEVKKVLEHMKSFCGKVHSGEWKGYTGKK